MKPWTAPQQAQPWAVALTRWATNSPAATTGLALVLVALVATLDHATGYELRLAMLYLVQIALATWVGGLRAGGAIIALSSFFWLVSFGSSHPYLGDFFFYWEGVVMVVVYIAFVLLLARLRVALTRADERFVRVLEELHAAVYVADQESGRILYANRSLARMIDADPDALGADELGKRFGLGEVTGESAIGDHKELIKAEIVAREVRDPISGRWYLVQVVPIPWKSSRRVSVQVITDITEKKRAKALKQQHQDMLHQTARLAALAEIATSLAHEVNQPLMAIASYNDACLRMLAAPGFEKKELVTALKRCREQALRAGKIIGRVRDFIRSRRPSPTHFDINALIRESLELLETQLEDSAMTTELSLSETPLITHADQTLLLQVVVNLVQNAIDAMEESAPSSRRLGLSSARAADGAILVSVSDQGAGIPEVIAVRLYTPLFTTKSQGLGLGLSICRSVVEAHGGRIWHRANPVSGTTFHFTLPPEID